MQRLGLEAMLQRQASAVDLLTRLFQESCRSLEHSHTTPVPQAQGTAY